jgi:hypothetical protein
LRTGEEGKPLRLYLRHRMAQWTDIAEAMRRTRPPDTGRI